MSGELTKELEKQLAMMKMGVVQNAQATPVAPVVVDDFKEEELAEIPEPIPAPTPDNSGEVAGKAEEKIVPPTPKKAEPYASWQTAIERIGELKRPLASQLSSAKVYKMPDNSILIAMNEFFAARIASSAADFAIVRGVIAEIEGKSADEILIKIKASKPGTDDLASELEKIIN